MAMVRMCRSLEKEELVTAGSLGFGKGEKSKSHLAVLRILVAISALLAMRSVFKRSILKVCLNQLSISKDCS